MNSLLSLVIMMSIAALLVDVAQRFRIPYPITLVLGGTCLGFLPGLNPVFLNPNSILVLVLPPILYYGAYWISFREFKKNLREIFSLALGLVIATTIVIGIIFKALFPELSWSLAFAVGAIISPPDAMAATAILRHFNIGTRLSTILEGESLVNDASALVLYRLAVNALLIGSFSFVEGVEQFFFIASGGILIGVITGLALQIFSRQFLDPVVGLLFSFIVPYLTYILADSLGVSGVLAVVVNGLMGARIIIKHASSLRRVLGYTTWDIFIIFLNCFVFILIGSQLRGLTAGMTGKQIILYASYGILIMGVLTVLRLVWVYARKSYAYFKARQDPKKEAQCQYIFRESAIIGWSGMRGIVSLAAALALPITHGDGSLVEGREIAIFIVFIVILLSLLIPGLTLPFLIRWLHIHPGSEAIMVKKIRKKLLEAASKQINYLHETNHLTEEEQNFLMNYFIAHHHIFETHSTVDEKKQKLESARIKIIQAQRRFLLQLWESGEVGDHLFTQLERELDIEEAHATRAEIS
ncbi:Na+/H+ antiporter [Candidatus Protochlamydia phocaeensis]|uniref:Na+/H+ antiporter n=1 Tax=Candidatus Protochlamydia phocaeensis TaxID=1414722 RepID=UPI000839204C|nr:Na+/H+ antiporter [Candidatus Protochlamydia phocaeensis]